MQFVDEEIYPAAASAGAWNAFYMSNCDVVGHRPAYCICVNKIQAMERDGKLPTGMSCEREIRHRECPALEMREQEVLADKAIYFVNRNKLQEFNRERERVEREKLLEERQKAREANGKKSSRPAPTAAPAPTTAAPDTGSYADAINAAMREATKPPAPPPKPVEPPAQQPPAQVAPKAGLSLLELARQKMAAAHSQQPGA